MVTNNVRSIIKSHIRKVKTDNIWDVTNKTLYNLCKKYPDHKKSNEIVAKAIIIGRVYAAALERGKPTTFGKGDEFYRTAVPDTMKRIFNTPDVKKIVAKLNRKADIDEAISLHKITSEQLTPLRKINKFSFTSKYLHFHFPKAYYILDSRAKVGLPILEKMFEEKLKRDQKFKKTTPYGKFYYRAEFMRNQIQELIGEKLTHREFDSLLLHISSIV